MENASISFPFLGSWSINPSNTFVLFGHTFYWYGVIIAAGFLLAVAYCLHRCPEFGIRQDDAIDCLLFAVPLAIIGARAYYVLFYGHYDSFADMCKIWEGGLAIYGGIIASVLTVAVVCRVKHISVLALLDVMSFGLLIGQSVGRWGNFINREAFGYETEIFCRMGLTLDGITTYVHPTFLYESLWTLVGFVGMHILSKKRRRLFDGQYFLQYLGWYGLGRVWIEGLRSDSLYLGSTSIRISQLLSAVAVAASAVLLVFLTHRARQSPKPLYVDQVEALKISREKEAEEEAKSAEKSGELSSSEKEDKEIRSE